MSTTLVWSALLVVLGLALVVCEVFIPSGGVLGFLSIMSLLSGIVLAFYEGGSNIGFTVLMVTAVLVPSVLALAFRYWPHTPMGRRLLLGVPNSEDVLPDNAQRRSLRQLVGKLGVAKSLMLPSGAVLVEGRLIDALSEGVPIEAGQQIRVVDVRGNQVLVRPAEETVATSGKDVLTEPIENLGPDPFEDPLA